MHVFHSHAPEMNMDHGDARVTTSPLVPQDCDLRDFPFMPLDVLRLRDSELALKATGEAFRCAVLLWCAAWHQVPAGSLPDDDETLAAFAGYGRAPRDWKKHRSGALRGWIKCNDGRLYHPVVAEKANEAWRAKLEQRWKTECARIKKHCQRHQIAFDPPDFDNWMSQGCPQGQPLHVPRDTPDMSQGHPPIVPGETHSKGQGQGQGQGEVNPEQAASTTGPESRDQVPVAAPPDAVTGRALQLVMLLRPRGASLQAGDPRVRSWAERGVTDAQALQALEIAQQRRQDASDPSPINAGYLDAILLDAVVTPVGRSPPSSSRTMTREEGRRIAAATRLSDFRDACSADQREQTDDDNRTIDGSAARLLG